ncbi:SpoIIE family protein phosphatase [Streptomyces sp. NPDC005706]|uniref:SpoIIE family protein phosphatase n=1 Tax=Streptomyces sp. NPDC005706 TaxID=3157169 RepID=UPI0033D62528
MSGFVDRSLDFGAASVAILDAGGTVVRWSRAAAELVGREAAEVCGQPVQALFAGAPEALPGMQDAGRVMLRTRSGSTVEVTFRVVPLADSSELLVLAGPTWQVTEWEHSVSCLRGLLAQDQIGVGLFNTDLSIVRTNVTPEMFGGPSAPPARLIREMLSAEDASNVEVMLRRVMATGVPVVERHQSMRFIQMPEREWVLSLSAFRLEDARGHPTGVATIFTNITEQERDRQHLHMLHEAALRIGGSLDLRRTAQQVADAVVPALGDMASMDLSEKVLVGDEPSLWMGGGNTRMMKVAVASLYGAWPASHVHVGELLPVMPEFDKPLQDSLLHAQAVLFSREEFIAVLGGDERLVDLLVVPGGHSTIVAPLYARGLALGILSVWRVDQPEPFTRREVDLVRQIASRGALAIDNARRYTREHRAAVTLQRRLLPKGTSDSAAAETAAFYWPAGGGAEIGGDWFDVIPLPSLRVAVVVGDVIGHGLHASATMGRLRTAVRTLAELELDPEDLFTHIADLIQRLAEETPPELQDTVGATCLYAAYDPVTCQCTLVSAGHPPPVVIRPDGATHLVDLSPGPPLAVGGMPYETTTITLEPGSVLALYTDGLIERDDQDIGNGLRQLISTLSAQCGPDRDLNEVGPAIQAELGDHSPRDDIALLLARTRALPAESTVSWDFTADPAEVASAREACTAQLAAWELEELAFTTELIISELVTNAIRYGGASGGSQDHTNRPISLRLIRDNVLVCEVTDPSNTQPRLRRALTIDEGGRGLFLIAQLSTRWGCRYGRRGKTIWAEQSLPNRPTNHSSTLSISST